MTHELKCQICGSAIIVEQGAPLYHKCLPLVRPVPGWAGYFIGRVMGYGVYQQPQPVVRREETE